MSSELFEPRAGKMSDRVTSGIFVTGFSQMARVLSQMGSVILLSRLLAPADFGIVAMASPFFGLISLFQDLGLGQALVQRKSITHDEVNALFWINIMVGLVLGLAVILCAPVAGWFYGNRQVVSLLMAMSVIIFIAMFGSQQSSILTRRMEFGRLAILDALSAVTGLVASVGFALIWKTYWAIYAGMVLSTVVPAFGGWIMTQWRPTWPRHFDKVRTMLHFGAGVTGFNLCNFIARNLDNALIGHRWGDAPLGLYDRAYKLLLFPLQQVTNPVAKVMVPALSRLRDEPDRYRSAFLRALGLVLLITAPGVVFMITTSDTLIPLVLGAKWAAAAPIFKMLGFAGFMQILNNPSGWLQLSQGRTKLMAGWGVFSAGTSAIAFLIGLPYGPLGVATAYAISEYVRTPVLWGFITRRGPVNLKALFGALHPVYAGALVAMGLLFAGHDLMAHLVTEAALVIEGIAAYAVTMAVMAVFPQGRVILGEGAKLASQMLKKVVKR